MVSEPTVTERAERLQEAVRSVPDPEIPVVTLDDLGIVRSVEVDADAEIARVVLTPTYSGCPAVEAIERHVEHVVREAGFTPDVVTQLSPPWSTDWISENGKRKLREFGIAPPLHTSELGDSRVVSLGIRAVACPRCGSTSTEEISRFGSTACKALRRCLACSEPFDEFKVLA